MEIHPSLPGGSQRALRPEARARQERFNLLTENRFFNYGPKFIEEKARELRSQLFGWFRTYVDPDKDGALEPVAGRGQLCKVGPEANGRNPFHPAVAVEYHR